MDSTLLILAVDRSQFNNEMQDERRDVSPPFVDLEEHRRTDVAPFAGGRVNSIDLFGVA